MAGPTKSVALNFEKMNKAGLMPLAKKFQRYNLEVTDIEATNKPKRDSGFQTKEATFIFSDGQKVLVKVKADGTVFQVKLNNKVVPIKHVDDMDRAIIEVVDYVQGNAKNFAKSQEKRAVKAGKDETVPAVRTTRAEQIEKYNTRIAELQAEHENLSKSGGDAGSQVSMLQSKLSEMQAELDELVARGTELEKELQSLQEAA